MIEKVLEYLNTGRSREMTEEMHRCSLAQSLTEMKSMTGTEEEDSARLAELLRDSGHEETHRRIESVTISQNPNVRLEALEETKDENL